MREGLIRFATYEFLPVQYQIERQEIREDLVKWHQRLAVWLAKKAGAVKHGYEQKVSYETRTFDMRGAMERMLEHRHNFEMVSSGRAKYLIVGRDQMDKLYMQDALIRHLGVHRTPPIVKAYSDRGAISHREMFYDLEVVYVPYIDGCFVLPDLIER